MKHKKIHKKYWFKRRVYGYGWVPTSWQGATLTSVCLLSIIALTYLYLVDVGNPTARGIFCYIATIALIIVVLIAVSFLMGPRPRWRWGRKPSDNPEEDF